MYFFLKEFYMNRLLLITTLALAMSMPVYAAQYTNTGNARYAAPQFTRGGHATQVVAESEQDSKQVLPIQLNGDEGEYDSASGDFYLAGNVKIRQGQEEITTPLAYGNMKTGDVWLEQGGAMSNPGMRMEGKWIHYNFNTKTGAIKEISGEAEKEWYKAPSANIYADHTALEEGGILSRCPAKEHPPCLSIEAKKFEVYPHDKIVAHDVKVLVRGKQVYSRKLWVKDMEGGGTRILPRIGYSGHGNGAYIKLDGEWHFNEKTSAEAELVQYEKAGFKPNFALKQNERNFTVKLSDGWEENDDDWYKKENNVRVDYKPHYFMDGVPLTYSGYFEAGKWTNDATGRDSNRTEGALYLNHDPIHLFNSENTVLNLTLGKKWAHESDSDASSSTKLYYATLGQKLGKRLVTWVGYYYEDVTSSLFDLGQPDMEKEVRNGLSYTLDDRNTLTIVNRYDVGGGHQFETNYRWLHEFCCWALEVEYQQKQYEDEDHLRVYYYFYNI